MYLDKANKGFTLIEVLVAIAVFASLSLAAYQVVNQVQRSNAQSQEVVARLTEIQRALVYMDADFRQIALRDFRHEGESAQGTTLLYADGVIEAEGYGILFTRLGWQNPQQFFPRGEISKVGYRIQNETLERVWWRYPDTPVAQEPIVTPILTQVEELNARFYDGTTWKNNWETNFELPKAVAIELRLTDHGEIERIYLTPSGRIDSGKASASEGDNAS